MERKQTNRILQDLKKKMVFLTGPRQVGKTWLAHEIAKSYSNSLYLTYDRREDELLSKVVFELKIKRQSGFQESPRFHQRIVHLQSPLPGNQSHVTFSNSFLHIVPA